MQPPKLYLEQARFLDIQISSKLRQLEALKADILRAEDVHADTAKMIQMQQEINAEIDTLIDTKQDIRNVINQLTNPHYRALLEMRYLCFDTWEAIADALHYDVRWVHVLHGRALQEVGRILYPGG